MVACAQYTAMCRQLKKTLTLALEPETSLLAVQSIIFQLHTVVYCLLEATSALHSDQCFIHYIQ